MRLHKHILWSEVMANVLLRPVHARCRKWCDHAADVGVMTVRDPPFQCGAHDEVLRGWLVRGLVVVPRADRFECQRLVDTRYCAFATGMKIARITPDHPIVYAMGWFRRPRGRLRRTRRMFPKSSRAAWVTAETGFHSATRCSGRESLERDEGVGHEHEREDDDERGVVHDLRAGYEHADPGHHPRDGVGEHQQQREPAERLQQRAPDAPADQEPGQRHDHEHDDTEPLVPTLSLLGSAERVSIAGVTLVLAFLTLVLGELENRGARSGPSCGNEGPGATEPWQACRLRRLRLPAPGQCRGLRAFARGTSMRTSIGAARGLVNPSAPAWRSIPSMYGGCDDAHGGHLSSRPGRA
jgi:hypothetical protein